jgi:putative acetyltransferase
MTAIFVEKPEHYQAVRELTIAAFAASELGHNGEAELIDALRQSSQDVLALVAMADAKVIGHILFSAATIQSEQTTFYGMALAPLAVLPAYQRCGVGSLLVQEGLRRIDESAASFAIVIGHAAFYSRFGFVPASNLSIRHGFQGMSQKNLFIRPSQRIGTSELQGSRAYFHSIFGPQHLASSMSD